MASGGSMRQKGKQKLLLNSVQQEMLADYDKSAPKNFIFTLFAKVTNYYASPFIL
jgi:hypothetical protein